MRLGSLLKGSALQAALVSSDGARTSYQALSDEVALLSSTMKAEGVGPGVVVAVGCKQPRAFVVAALAVWDTGAAVLPLDSRGSEAWQQGTAKKGRASFCVSQSSATGELFLQPLGAELPVPTDVGLILMTSGSSGTPKAVMLTGSGVQANVDAILDYLPVAQFPVTGVLLPLSYSYALVGQVLVTLRSGGTVVLLQDVPFPLIQLQKMAELGVQGVSTVPTSLRQLAQARPEATSSPALKYLASAGAPMDEATRSLVFSTFPGIRFFNQYGLTEASPRVTAMEDDGVWRPHCVGYPLRGIRVRAVQNGAELGPNEEGELCVEGPSVMRGYLDDESATVAAFVSPGRMRTGDSGWLDADGRVYVRGRMDGVLKIAGERVSTEEVARYLGSQVAVVAIPDEKLGQKLIAFVEGDAPEVAAAQKRARELPPAKRPAAFHPVPSLPRTERGKLDVVTLKQWAQK